MADAENGTRYADLLRLLREFARRCVWAAMALDAEADVVALGLAARLRGEAEAAWQAAGQARAAAEAAAHQFSLHDELPLDVAAVYGAVLDLPATDAQLANALTRFEAMVKLGGGVASPDAAGLAGPMLAAYGGATPEAAAALTRALVLRSENPPTLEEMAALHAAAVEALRQQAAAEIAAAARHAEAMRLAALFIVMVQVRHWQRSTRQQTVPLRTSARPDPREVAQRESLGQHRPHLSESPAESQDR